MADPQPALRKTLSGLHLWGIAVGLVISGEYFGWSYGWANAGTLGFLVTSLVIAAMYATFIFSFTELTCSIPHAGGPFAYARAAFGPIGGYFAGAATMEATAEAMINELRTHGDILFPGEPELVEETRRRADGIPIEPAALADMNHWSEKLGLQPLTPAAAA